MTHHLTGTLADVGEFALIGALQEIFDVTDHVLLGPGDDAAVVRVTTGEQVVSLDMLVQDRHFRFDWSSAYDVGRKAAATNLSDINAMGGRPTALVIGLAAPASLEVSWALDLARGIADECAEVGAAVVGGDLTRAEQVVVSVTVLGECYDGVVRRDRAQMGDVVALAGRQGWAEAGARVLGRGFRSPRAVVEAHRRPEPPYGLGAAAARGGAHAMIDVSDGLVQDTGHVARASGVAIDLRRDRLTVAEPVAAVGAALGTDPTLLVLTGGDDYGLVACFPPDAALPEGFVAIGEVVDGEVGVVTVDGEEWEAGSGYQHFR